MEPRRLQDFEGAWAFERTVTETDGRATRVTGRALWHPEGTRLICDEAGAMRVPGHPPMQVTRRYVWGPGLRVEFADGRHFHDVPPAGGPVAHWCAPDQYDGHYDFSRWPEFRVDWRVRGPHKSYHMITSYRREEE